MANGSEVTEIYNSLLAIVFYYNYFSSGVIVIDNFKNEK